MYRAYIVNDITPFMGHLPLEAVTQFTDAAWVLHLEEKGNSGKTIANKYGFFAGAMAAAARMRPKPLIAYNPCIGTRLPRHDQLVEVDDQGNVVVDRLAGTRPSPYTLRHTGISWRLLGGVPMFVVSRDAGHDSYDTTDKRYGHLDRTASAAAAQVLAAKIPRLNNLPGPAS
jgi:hypothetical protein